MKEMDIKVTRQRSHTVTMDNRERVSVTGVEDVPSFNENEVVMTTQAGVLTMFGQNMHIARLSLDEGQLVVEGLIFGMDYADHQPEKVGLFTKLFK